MFKYFLLLINLPTIVLASSYPTSFWNTFFASIIVGVLFMLGTKLFTIFFQSLLKELYRFFYPSKPKNQKNKKRNKK